MNPYTGLMLIGLILLGWALVSHGQPRPFNRVWYWNHLVPGLGETPDLIYAQVQQRLREGIKVRQLPLKGLGFGPTHLFETRSIFSERPLYLEARYKHSTYYLYVSQTPAGLYVSQWLFSKYTDWLAHPIKKWFVAWYLYRQTLFQFDATLMFGESMHAVVLEILDRYIQEEGLPPLEAFERRPVLQSFYGSVAAGYPAAQPAITGAAAGGRKLPL